FFQAEDGIRDYKVTGVQTCALPILIVAELGVASVSELGASPPIAPPMVSADVALPNVPSTVQVCGAPNTTPAAIVAVPLLAAIEIGRASCRERGWSWGGGGA